MLSIFSSSKQNLLGTRGIEESIYTFKGCYNKSKKLFENAGFFKEEPCKLGNLHAIILGGCVL